MSNRHSLSVAVLVTVMYSHALCKTTSWNMLSNQNVTHYKAKTSARSVIECVRECGEYSPYCNTAAYEAFSRMCYLEVSTSASNGLAGNMGSARLYYDKDPKCTVSAAPAFPHADVTSWEHSLTSLTGQASCHADYLFVGRNAADLTTPPRISCLSSGQWETSGDCRQRIWRENTVSVGTAYQFPNPVSVGQTVCLTATPTRPYWFTVNLMHNTWANLPFQLNVRFNWEGSKMVVLNSKTDNSFGPGTVLQDPNHPFTFAVEQQFQMNITAIKSNQLVVYKDGILLGTWITPVSVDNINKIIFYKDVEVSYMDLACNT